jgi:hypothetical protein
MRKWLAADLPWLVLDEAARGVMIPQPGLTEEEITTFAREEPAVLSGLITFQVLRWLVGMKEKE